MEKKYEYLRLVYVSPDNIAADVSPEELAEKFEINFDPKVSREKVFSLPKMVKGIIKFKILEVAITANIQDILRDACNTNSFESIAFDTISTLVGVAESNESLLSKDAKTDLFVLGSGDNLFIVRVHKIKSGVNFYIGLENFDLPFKGENVHRVFVRA